MLHRQTHIRSWRNLMKNSKPNKNTFEDLDKSFNTKEVTKALEANLKKLEDERPLPAVAMSETDLETLHGSTKELLQALKGEQAKLIEGEVDDGET